MVNQLPQGWKEVKLKDICVLINGRAFKQNEFLDSGKYKVLRVGNFFSNNKWYYSDLELDNDKYCEQGDLLFAWSASFGPKIWNDKKTIYHYHIWKVKVNEFVEKKFLYYLLLADSQKIKKSGHGVAMIHITKMDMENRLYIIPTDKSEQKYIVDTLDAVAEMIKLRKETIQLAKDLILAIFHEMFGDPITNPKGWDKKNLGQVCDVRSGNAFPERYQGYTNGKPFYKVGDISRTIEENHIYLDKAKNYITDEIAQIIKAKSFSKNTIVFAKVGEALRLNRRALISKDAFIDNNVMGVSIKEDCNDLHYLYLYYHFVCNINLNFIKKEGAIPSVNNKDINNLYLPIPPLSLQKDFAKKVEQINDYIIAQQEELEQFETLFQSLLQEAFTGVLTWKYPRKECHDKKDK